MKAPMDTKLKPFQRIASRFQVSQESAKYFLNHVQKSFRIERPSHQLIVDFIESQQLEYLLTPYELAEMMNENGVWPYALGTAPSMVVSDEDIEEEK